MSPRRPVGKYDVACIEREGEWQALEADWRRLVRESENATLFSDWEWTRTWWEVFSGPEYRLKILVVSSAGRVVGIVPLCVFPAAYAGGIIAARVLRLLGSGEAAQDEVSTEYADFIVSPGFEADVAMESARFVFGDLGRDWDIAVFDNILEHAAILEHFLPAAAMHGARQFVSPIGRRYFAALPEDWETYLAKVSKRTRSNLLAAQRRFARLTGADVELHCGGGEVLRAFDRLAALHSERWRAQGLSGAFASARFVDFHRRFLNRMQHQGQEGARLWILTIDDRDVAAVYGLEQHGQLHIYQTGIDPRIYKNLSPGLLLLAHAISWSIERRLRIFDLMLSPSADYKARFSPQTAEMSRVLMFNRSLRGGGAYLFWRIKRGARKIVGAVMNLRRRGADVAKA